MAVAAMTKFAMPPLVACCWPSPRRPQARIGCQDGSVIYADENGRFSRWPKKEREPLRIRMVRVTEQEAGVLVLALRAVARLFYGFKAQTTNFSSPRTPLSTVTNRLLSPMPCRAAISTCV
jgi:hypothetical protein